MASTKHSGPFTTTGDSGGWSHAGQPLVHQHGVEVPRFGQMRLFPIALSYQARAQSGQLLNHILADSIILDTLYNKHHWLLRGHTFYPLHLLLDKHAGEQLTLIDLIAERVQALGGVAIADPRHVAEVTIIPRPANGAEQVPAILCRLLDAHEIVIEKVKDAITKTAANRDDGTNDMLMTESRASDQAYDAGARQRLWRLSETLVGMEHDEVTTADGGKET